MIPAIFGIVPCVLPELGLSSRLVSGSLGRSRAQFSLHAFKHKQLQEGLIRDVSLVGQGLELVEQRLGQELINREPRRYLVQAIGSFTAVRSPVASF